MSFSKYLNAQEAELVNDNLCPNCKISKLVGVSSSGRTLYCTTCNNAFVKPAINVEALTGCGSSSGVDNFQ